MREDFRFVGNGFQLAICNVGWLTTREFVILVPDPICFAPWSVLLDRGGPCDSCQDAPHVMVLCFFCPVTYHKSTGRAISSRQRYWTLKELEWEDSQTSRAEEHAPTTTPSSCGATTMTAASEARFMVSHSTVLPYRVKVCFYCVTSLAVLTRGSAVGVKADSLVVALFLSARSMECVLLVFSVANRQFDGDCCAETATSLATCSRSF